jgi:hypothetical protein
MGNSLRVAGAAVVAAVAIVAAGCGSNGSPSASSGTTTTTTAPGGGASTAARQAFEQCMAPQRQALTACRSKLPAGGRSGGAPGANRSNPAFAKYTACLKQHGVTFGASNNQKAFATASAACAKYRPAAGAGGGTSLQ